MQLDMNKIWKISFWVWPFITGVGFIVVPFGEPGLLDLLGLVFSAICLSSLYGLAFQVAVGTKVTAIFVFLLNTPFIPYILYMSFISLTDSPTLLNIVFNLIGMLLMTALFYPMYAYAFRSSDLWAEKA